MIKILIALQIIIWSICGWVILQNYLISYNTIHLIILIIVSLLNIIALSNLYSLKKQNLIC